MAGIARGGPETASPRRLADRGLVEELFQALVGAVLADDDHYGNATLNSPASHAASAITRVSNTQDHQSDCTYPGTVRVSEFVVDHSHRAAQRQASAARVFPRAGLHAVVRRQGSDLDLTDAVILPRNGSLYLILREQGPRHRRQISRQLAPPRLDASLVHFWRHKDFNSEPLPKASVIFDLLRSKSAHCLGLERGSRGVQILEEQLEAEYDLLSGFFVEESQPDDFTTLKKQKSHWPAAYFDC